MNVMGNRSLTLQSILRKAGYIKGSGVSGKGIALVSRLAKENGVRDWPHTRTVEDYDALISLTEAALASPTSDEHPEVAGV